MDIVLIQPTNWSGSRNFITAEKFKTSTSYGKEFTRYKVITRHTLISDNFGKDVFKITDTSKGLVYSAGEVTELNSIEI